MKKIFLSGMFALALPLGVYAQTTFATENLPIGVCQGTKIWNGDLAVGLTPNTNDNTIGRATGFSPIWGSGSSAEFYGPTYTPIGSPPSPASGNYASFWVANNNINNGALSGREGFKVKVFGIQKNTGWYTLKFDMACLSGFGTAELGVYGIYNPNDNYSATPTGFNVPTNMNLFGTANTVLAGTILVSNRSSIKSRKTIYINTNAANFPSNGITHLMFTHSGNSQSGAHYTAFDDFCLIPSGSVLPVSPTPSGTTTETVLTPMSDVNVFPNPAFQQVQVRWSTENVPNELTIRIFNVNGIEVQSISAVNGHEGQLELDTKDLGAGLYFIKIEGENYNAKPITFAKTNRG